MQPKPKKSLNFSYFTHITKTWEMCGKVVISLNVGVRLPPGLLAQVVPSHPSDFQLRGSSPCINTYLAKKNNKNYVKQGNKSINSTIEVL